jgi:hypothetical protein
MYWGLRLFPDVANTSVARMNVRARGSQVWRLPESDCSGTTPAPQQVFKAKGAKPNAVGNVDLPHVTAVTFLPDPSGALLLAGTVKHKLWLYDVRAGQRPQADVSWGSTRITCLTPQHDGSRVWVANGTGHMEALDMRARKMQVCVNVTRDMMQEHGLF